MIEKDFISIEIRKVAILGSLQHPINKACSTKLVHRSYIVASTTSFSSDYAFPNVNIFAKKLKLLINDSDSKENENNVNVTG